MEGEDHSRMITWRGKMNTAHHTPIFFSEQSSMNTSMVSLQNMPHSATVLEVGNILFEYGGVGGRGRAGSRRTSYVTSKISPITLLEPGTVLYGPRLRTLDSSGLLSTSPTKSFRNTRFCGPRHISTTCVALHLTPNQAHVLKKLHGEAMIAEKVRETSERTTSPARVSRNRQRFHGVFPPFSLERRGRQLHTTISARRMAVQEVCNIVRKRHVEYMNENENLNLKKRKVN